MTQESGYCDSAEKARADLVNYGRKIAERGLVAGPGGNTSVRVGDVVYLKASGAAMEDAKPEHYIGISLETGEVVDGIGKPSCEILMHLGIYKARPDVGAVCHTHAPISSGIASAGKTIPPLLPDGVAMLGKNIPLVRYVIPAGSELAVAATEALKECDVALLANHGVLTVGANMREAYFRSIICEDAAKTYIAALIAGKPNILTDKEADEINNLEAEDYRRALIRGDVG